MKKLFKLLFALALGLAFSVSTYGQETVYCIAAINSNPTPISSYSVTGTTLTWQSTVTIPRLGGGAVGLTMNETDKILYVTYEISGTLQMINALNMTAIGTVTAPGAGNLAGLVYDHDNDILYAIDRNTNRLYRWTWNAVSQTLTLIGTTYTALPSFSTGYDLDIDEVNDVIYASSAAGYVNWYSTANLTVLGGTIPFPNPCNGVAYDGGRNLLYTTGGFSGSTNLHKYDLTTTTLTTYNLGTRPIGVDVNKQNGYVYCTNYYGPQNLVVVDPNTGAVTWNSGDIGNPTGVVYTGVGYNPLGLTITPSAPCFVLGQNVTYTLNYLNGNPTPVTGTQITFTFPANTSFVSSTGGAPPPVGNVVSWDIGTIPASTGGSVTVTVKINSGATAITTSTIDSNETGLVAVNHQIDTCTSVPLSNWAIYILIAMIGIAVWFRYRRSIA